MDIPVPAIVEGSCPSLDELPSPVYNQVHQEQIAAEQESFERVQQHTVEQIIHVPIPQIQEQIVVGVKEVPQDRFPEQSVEQIENATPALVFPVRHQFQ